MEHKRVDELRGVADVKPAILQDPASSSVPGISPQPSTRMSRSERLARWIEVLEQDPQRRLRSLGEIEFKPRAERPLMRSDNSPLTIAFEDPVLRAEGLASDRLGDAMTFFEMSEREAHYALCSCLNGMSMKAGAAASRVRGIAQRSHVLNTALIVVGAAAALPALAYLLG